MSTNLPDITARVRLDTSDLKTGAARVNAETGKITKEFGRIGPAVKAAALAGVAGLAVFAKSGVAAASDLEQSVGAVDSVFEDAAQTVKDFAAKAASSVGLAKDEYGSLAAVVGSQLQRLGQSQEESAVSTDKLIRLGADLAATYGGSVSEAVEAVSSLLRGERDPIERYAVGINEATISARLASEGLGNLTGKALDNAKAQATLTELFAQTSKVQGAFGRESNTLAGQQERLSAQFRNVQADLTTALLPALTRVTEALAGVARFVQQNSDVIVPLGVALGTLAGAVVLVNSAVRAYTAAQAALNVVLAANPIGLVIVAVAALVAGLVVAYKHSETFRNVVNNAFSTVRDVVVPILNTIKTVVTAVFRYVADYVGDQIAAVKQIVRGGLDVIAGIFTGDFGRIKEGVTAILGGLLTYVGQIPRRILSALGNLGGVLKDAGKDLIQGLIDGIKSMIGKVGGVMGELTGKLGRFLPGSPVREGPLVSWNNGGAGKRLLEMLGGGIADGIPGLARQMQGVAAVLAVPDVTATLAASTATSRTGSAASSAGASYVVNNYGVTADRLGENTVDVLRRMELLRA